MTVTVRRRPRPSIPLAHADELAPAVRRTGARRLALASAAVALLAGAVVVAGELRTRPNSYFGAGGSGIVVTDLSSSVDPIKYRRLGRVLRTLTETGQPVGFVVFSDTAYEMLPPGTRGEELRAMLRFFEPPERTAIEEFRDAGFGYPESPWSGSFRGGTRISTGLKTARAMIARDSIPAPSVLLISDLDDSPFDTPALTQEIVRYQREGIQLRLVPLFSGPEDRRFFSRLLGGGAFVGNDELVRNSAIEERLTLVASFPIALAVVGALLLLLLALNEHFGARLSWRRAV